MLDLLLEHLLDQHREGSERQALDEGGGPGLRTTRESTRDRTAAMRARATVSWLPNCKARAVPETSGRASESHLREMGQLESVSVAEFHRFRARLPQSRCDDATLELRPSNSTMSAKFHRPSRLTSPSKIWGVTFHPHCKGCWTCVDLLVTHRHSARVGRIKVRMPPPACKRRS